VATFDSRCCRRRSHTTSCDYKHRYLCRTSVAPLPFVAYEESPPSSTNWGFLIILTKSLVARRTAPNLQPLSRMAWATTISTSALQFFSSREAPAARPK
jgi:hypothetical protein